MTAPTPTSQLPKYRYYLFIHDAGRQWLRLPHDMFDACGLSEHISIESCIDADFVYLEDTVDTPRYLARTRIDPRRIKHEKQQLATIPSLHSYIPSRLRSFLGRNDGPDLLLTRINAMEKRLTHQLNALAHKVSRRALATKLVKSRTRTRLRLSQPFFRS